MSAFPPGYQPFAHMPLGHGPPQLRAPYAAPAFAAVTITPAVNGWTVQIGGGELHIAGSVGQVYDIVRGPLRFDRFDPPPPYGAPLDYGARVPPIDPSARHPFADMAPGFVPAGGAFDGVGPPRHVAVPPMPLYVPTPGPEHVAPAGVPGVSSIYAGTAGDALPNTSDVARNLHEALTEALFEHREALQRAATLPTGIERDFAAHAADLEFYGSIALVFEVCSNEVGEEVVIKAAKALIDKRAAAPAGAPAVAPETPK